MAEAQGQQLTPLDTTEATSDSSSKEEATETRGEYSVDASLPGPLENEMGCFHSCGKVLLLLWLRFDVSVALASSTTKNVFFTVTFIANA
jgi:hypothetical protein